MLQGFKVVELATHIAAPAAAGIMADWGADVIKIESIQGDPMRWFRAHAPGGCSPSFETDNRGKRSLALNIATAEGRDIIRRLVGEADVFLTNLRPDSLRRAGLDWPALRSVNQTLVYTSVTGYGLQGGEANTPAFDNAAYWSRSGMAHMTRPEGQDPFSIRQGSGDHTCAIATALAIIAALLSRTKTGKGQLVETSLLRTGVFVMGSDLSNQLRLGEVAATRDRTNPVNPINNFFKTADARWIFVMPRNSQPTDWLNICAAVDLTGLGQDPRFATSEGRAAHSAEIVRALDEGFAALDFAVIAARFTAADLVWSPVQNLQEVIDDPQANAAGCFVTVQDEAGQHFRAPASPARFSDETQGPKRTVARHGQHTDAILAGIGFNPSEIQALRDDQRVK